MSMTYSEKPVERPELSAGRADQPAYVPPYARHRHRSDKKVKTWMILAPIGAVVLVGAGAVMLMNEAPTAGAPLVEAQAPAAPAPLVDPVTAGEAALLTEPGLGMAEAETSQLPIAAAPLPETVPVAPVRRATAPAARAAPAAAPAETTAEPAGPQPYLAQPDATSPQAPAILTRPLD